MGAVIKNTSRARLVAMLIVIDKPGELSVFRSHPAALHLENPVVDLYEDTHLLVGARSEFKPQVYDGVVGRYGSRAQVCEGALLGAPTLREVVTVLSGLVLNIGWLRPKDGCFPPSRDMDARHHFSDLSQSYCAHFIPPFCFGSV